MALKHNSSNAGSSDAKKRSFKLFPLSEKVKVLNLVSKEKTNRMLRLLRSTVRTNLLSKKKKNKEIGASLGLPS